MYLYHSLINQRHVNTKKHLPNGTLGSVENFKLIVRTAKNLKSVVAGQKLKKKDAYKNKKVNESKIPISENINNNIIF